MKEFHSREGAKMVARYTCIISCCVNFVISLCNLHRFFQKLGDISSALQFLVLSGCQEDAFQMAEVCYHDCSLW